MDLPTTLDQPVPVHSADLDKIKSDMDAKGFKPSARSNGQKKQKRNDINNLAPGKYIAQTTRKWVYECQHGAFLVIAFQVMGQRDPADFNSIIRKDFGNYTKSYSLSNEDKVEELAQLFRYLGLRIEKPSDLVEKELPEGLWLDVDVIFSEKQGRNFVGRLFASNVDYDRSPVDAVQASFPGSTKVSGSFTSAGAVSDRVSMPPASDTNYDVTEDEPPF